MYFRCSLSNKIVIFYLQCQFYSDIYILDEFYFNFRFRHLNHAYIKPLFVKDVSTATKADKVLNVYHSITEQHALKRAETHPDINGDLTRIETSPEINGGQKIPLLNAV